MNFRWSDSSSRFCNQEFLKVDDSPFMPQSMTKIFAFGNFFCHPGIELSKGPQCHQVWPMSSSMTVSCSFPCECSLPSWLSGKPDLRCIQINLSDYSLSVNMHPQFNLNGRDHSIHWTMMKLSAQNLIIWIIFCERNLRFYLLAGFVSYRAKRFEKKAYPQATV